ncbi:two-component regulator propeller domain-containing protein [uncultured Lutibacter sp.]|uniref:hybrid sensor histidine kinase/response regulator transcription factor n=1 Tax=uncultured Lutibacter sp. TaxID=437739 RepID=UPI0026110B9E|nr:two-component regulator propeller domain-containing protein [uncultured Lutibacter sp.]
MLKLTFKLFFIVLFSITSLFSQESNLEYSRQLSIYEGLAHNGVTSILEDSKGYLWFGTYDGLNKYDGYSLKTYKNTVDEKLLVSNRVRSLKEDTNGNLWIGTDRGITIYDYITEQFKNIYSNNDLNKGVNGPIVREILVDKHNELIVCATEDNGIMVFDEDYSFIRSYKTSYKSGKNSFFTGLKIDNEKYLFCASNGLELFNINTGKFQKVLHNKLEVNTPTNDLVKVNRNTFLVTLNSGVALINYKPIEEKFKLKSIELKEYKFSSLSIDKLNNLWLGTTTEGVVKINNVFSFTEGKDYKISRFFLKSGVTRISSIASNTKSGCWVTTFNKGVFQFDINENLFRSFNTEMDFKNAIQTNNLLSLSTLDENRFYVSASQGGLGIFDISKEKFDPLPFNLPESLRKNVGYCFVDSKKNLWFKISVKGLCRVKANSTRIENITDDFSKKYNSIQPRTIAEDEKGNIWIGSSSDIHRISFNKDGDVQKIVSLNEKHPYFQKNKLSLIRFIYVDPLYDFIWVGDDSDGLYRLSLENKNVKVENIKVDQYVNSYNDKKSISSNFVTSIIRLPNKELWIGTEGGGICKVINSEKDPEFLSLTEKNGLSNNVVKSILYDQENNLWVSTNIGLNKVNIKDFSVRRFTKEDGLPFEDFWYAAQAVGKKTLVFSGLDGFCYFEPDQISNKEILPRLEFGAFKLFNNIIEPGDTINDRILLQSSLTELEKINLKYNENVFSIDLISLHFSNPKNHSLKYRLLPISEEWIEVPSNQNTIHYNGLPAGEYELNVMASDAAGNWTPPKKLKINITPPFWKTGLAYFLYLSLLGLLIYIVVYVVLKIQSLNHKVEIEQLEIDNVKDLNKAKLRFFSNISHEIKTPLTLISGPVSILADRFKSNKDVSSKLSIIQRQSKKISQLIDQVHDFQRADANLLKMHFTSFCFNEFIEELVSDFKFMAEIDKKEFELKNNDSKIFVSADKDKLEKIFNNLLNNAFKYTKSGDTIKIDFERKNNNLIVHVKDTGRGIDTEDIEHIFERFYQSQKKHGAYTGGSGIGLAFSKRLVDMHYGYINATSKLNEGSEFTIVLPIVKNAILKDQEQAELKILTAEKTYTPTNEFENEINISGIEVDGSFSNAKIFFAEDNSEMRGFVFGILSNFFEVKSFENGQECLKALENEWPDIIISDVLMPELNGFELCKQIKSDIKTSHIPVILLTASTSIEDELHGLKYGADSYIKKPFNIQYLVTKTEALLKSRKALRERFKIELPLNFENNIESSKDASFLEKLYNLMEKNLDNQDLDLNSFAKELYLNRTHFYKKVKALTDQTPFELLKAFRLKKAAEFLRYKKLSVNEVYSMTGFKSRTHFSRLFKETFNISPGKYASESKKEELKKE